MLVLNLLKFIKQPNKHESNFICEINFDSAIFYPSENLTGNLVISIRDTPCVIEHLIVELSGKAQCTWNQNKYFLMILPCFPTKQKYSGRDVFMMERQNLTVHHTAIKLSKNPQIYFFKLSLKDGLPPSWTGQYGKIEYIVKVLIKEDKKGIESFDEEVIIGAHRNLSLEKHLLCEARTTTCRQFYYSFINLGTVEINLWLPVCGISAGQSLPVLCTIANYSSILFGGLIFVLTKIEHYKSHKPTEIVKTYRTDVCRVPRMVDIFKGNYQFYCILKTNKDFPPTNQHHKCPCCQLTYEIWVSVQGALPRYKAYGYPNISTPPIPLIVGTKPIVSLDCSQVSKSVINALYEIHPLVKETLLDEEAVQTMLHIDEILDEETQQNLATQLSLINL